MRTVARAGVVDASAVDVSALGYLVGRLVFVAISH